jgi:hypothetical protein
VDSRDEKKRPKDQNTLLLIAVATFALGILGAGCYYLGKSFTRVNDLSKEINNIEKLNEFVIKTEEQISKSKEMGFFVKQGDVLASQLRLFREIAGSKEIFTEFQTDVSRDLKLRISIIAGAIIMGVGAVFASEAAMIAGAAVLTFTACLMLLKAGIGFDKSGMVHDLEKIKLSVKIILNVLNNVPRENIDNCTYFYKREPEVIPEVVQQDFTSSAPPTDEEFYRSIEESVPVYMQFEYSPEYINYNQNIFESTYEFRDYSNYHAQNQQNGYNY